MASSDVGIHTRLARAHARKGDAEAARNALREARETWGQIPAAMRRRSLGRYLDAQLARLWLVHEPMAIGVAVVAVALTALAVRQSLPTVRGWVTASPAPAGVPYTLAGADPGLLAAFERCGSERTGELQGNYVVDPESLRAELPTLAASATPEQRALNDEIFAHRVQQYANFVVKPDRIQSGTQLVQEFCLVRVIAQSGESLHAEAVWHEDVHDPGDASVVELRFERHGNGYRFGFNEVGSPVESWITLERQKLEGAQ
jgi:hypothetical protein